MDVRPSPNFDLRYIVGDSQDESQLLIQDERERIACALHDNLAQDVVYINLQAATIRMLLAKGEVSRALEQLQLLEEVSGELSSDIRAIISRLHNPGQIDEGLETALAALIDRFSRRSCIPVSYIVGPHFSSRALSPQARTEIYFIVQEALINIHKHAKAGMAWVHLLGSEKCIDVVIRDDGRGFRPAVGKGPCSRHIGLPIMQARAEMIGAQLFIDHTFGEGTQLTLCIPNSPKNLPCAS